MKVNEVWNNTGLNFSLIKAVWHTSGCLRSASVFWHLRNSMHSWVNVILCGYELFFNIELQATLTCTVPDRRTLWEKHVILSSCQQLQTWWNCFINLGIAFVPSTDFLPVTQLRYIDISSINDITLPIKWAFGGNVKSCYLIWQVVRLINQWNLSLCYVCKIIL